MSREAAARARGFARVAGVDEVGRGPLAGPVVAAAVILDPARVPEGLADSKALSARRRAALVPLIRAHAVSLGACSARLIDEIGIEAATQLAMLRALAPLRADYALIDGPRLPRALAIPGEAVVKGDARSCSIAAASIVAKEVRDRAMRRLGKRHPAYGWENNAGYGAPAHRAAIRQQGGTPHHRWSFAPLRNM